jgi:hypothetical protein
VCCGCQKFLKGRPGAAGATEGERRREQAAKIPEGFSNAAPKKIIWHPHKLHFSINLKQYNQEKHKYKYNPSHDFKKTCISLEIFLKPLKEMIESFHNHNIIYYNKNKEPLKTI